MILALARLTAMLILRLACAVWCFPYMGFLLPLVLIEIFSNDDFLWCLPYMELFLPL